MIPAAHFEHTYFENEFQSNIVDRIVKKICMH